MENKLGRYIPDKCSPFIGEQEVISKIKRKKIEEKLASNKGDKLVKGIEALLDKLEIKDGMTISFHLS